MKTILGLDLGTNSVGWALIKQDFKNKKGEILGLGSRIIPMSQDILGEFERGNSISQTAERTRLRGVRRLRERHLLRRERLHRILNVIGFLPQHYANKIDFDVHLGKFLPETETKLIYDDNGNFIFKESFEGMLIDFKKYQPELLNRKNKKGEDAKIPYDWTIYYLRKKALTKKIEKGELAWLLLHFNQKRGYYQLRGEETEDKPNKLEDFYSLKVVDVTADEPQKGKSEIWYNIILENGWIYRRASRLRLFDWKDKIRDFIITTDLNEDGSIKKDKEGKEKRSFRSPKEDDWQLLKKKTENEIEKSNKTVGEYIYDALLQRPNQKIKGKLIRTIERKFYKNELEQILKKQIELHNSLQDRNLYQQCIEELYPHNLHHQFTLLNKDFLHFFIEDILYYQRPLRSQKSSISNCPLESRTFILEGVRKTESLKCISKSHPLYQEFRLWQWISNLRIVNRGNDANETENILSKTGGVNSLFEFLNERKEIDQKTLLKQHFKLKESNYRWNYVEDKKYSCNETHSMIVGRLEKVKDIPQGFLTPKKEEELWHIIYSVTDKIEYEKALNSFAQKNDLDLDSFYEAFKKFPPFPSNYGSYSAKAIKKLLPLMRTGKYWNEESIDEKTKDRITKIINAEVDETIEERVREKVKNLTQTEHFQGLPEWLAKYVVHNRHSERSDTGKWKTVQDLEEYLKSFRQHSLKNPIVEQVITETLRTVKDIWRHYGNGTEGFFDEIHIELGRDMKNPADKRKRLTEQVTKNENTNLRIKALLAEMQADNSVENVRPYSPTQQDILKIYEDFVLNLDIEIPEDIEKISKQAQPTSSELQRYKLWLEQRYQSPYTGKIIPLSKLFTPAYEIEHIIPQSRYFDDSFSNKVICEAAVNKLKDNQLGLEFIKNHHGTIIYSETGKEPITIFEVRAYEEFVKQHYVKNPSKRNKLLMEDIPQKMIERQINDTRYISKFIFEILSNVVRSESNDDGVNSKNVISGNGKITIELKQDWGLNDVWNDLILPRFERLNNLNNSKHFTTWNEKYQKYIPTVPLDLSEGFSKKRIDHRHHAMDALVIACATRDHINFLNNQYAKSSKRYDLSRKLKRYEKTAYKHPQTGERIEREIPQDFFKPWDNFTIDVKNKMENIIVSFKQNLRIINKTVNQYDIVKDGKKDTLKQQKGQSWAIRKPLHKDTVSGLVSLRKTKSVSLSAAFEYPENITDKPLRKYIQKLILEGYDKKKLAKHFKDNNNQLNGQDISKVQIVYWENDNVASRVSLDTTFNKMRIESITDTGIQKILLKHLENNKDNPEIAFSPEGIEEMNKKIVVLNNGKFHQPILKVRTYETKGNKFAVGQSGNKKTKFVEAAKGTNLFFAIYQDENGKRSFETVPLNVVLERQKQGLLSAPDQNEKGHKLLFYLSPNDLVYVLNEEEIQSNAYDIDLNTKNNISQIYKIVSFTGNRLYGVPFSIATAIVDKIEFSQLNKLETTIGKISLKDYSHKLSINRLGNIEFV